MLCIYGLFLTVSIAITKPSVDTCNGLFYRGISAESSSSFGECEVRAIKYCSGCKYQRFKSFFVNVGALILKSLL
ncbi:hypothetical protein QWZ16_08805 [Vibrio ostreicida]|uniref:Secreted protein n=1 Tax=Vibrio ostreicida TaxID=526588 RepID=A0ABT8BS58_9VIBR|nr:hypothetical protein [Vibrio ostreicida]MDN3609796.1 hypothetical protein [Vibrio ostreicida]